MQKEPRFHFGKADVAILRKAGELEFICDPPPRRFDALSKGALGIIVFSGSILAAELFLEKGVSGQAEQLRATVERGQEQVTQLWRGPLHRIAVALD